MLGSLRCGILSLFLSRFRKETQILGVSDVKSHSSFEVSQVNVGLDEARVNVGI
jgi:hypothetical protein